ncbi:hypothetical protein BJ741DRAFT_652287 [Chytriomyces cf. hyalinus JEL632]|nr:hypothetical protein BJ741DRAFT_652287 [Chytriomyces cf. hyalinus JEL632]
MSALSFVPHQLRNTPEGYQKIFPKAFGTETGIVAIIDISGYSKLSSHLQEVLGSDSGAKIKELLNPPIEIIIREVHLTGGSIVKFAGDAVIAIWAHTSNSESMTQKMICGSLVCCLNLLDTFRSYFISYEASVVGQLRQNSSNHGPHNNSNRNTTVNDKIHTDRSLSRGRASEGRPFNIKKNADVMKKQALKIHIGLGFGAAYQVHLGVHQNSTLVRAEMFIAGRALSESGILLGEGKEGDLVFGQHCWDGIKHLVSSEIATHFRQKQTENQFKVTTINEKDSSLHEFISVLNHEIKCFDFSTLDSGSECMPRTIRENFESQLSFVLPYLDDALSKTITTAISMVDKSVEPAHFEELLQVRLNYMLSSYDQTRSVCVIFIQFHNFSVDSVYEPYNLQKLQSIMKAIFGAIQTYQGCLRQINCDDKSLTALLVWGLQGFAHEKKEVEYALPAALEISSRLKNIIGSMFSIGITSGSVFSGIVGNANRADGTVLGVAVNNAARIMCLPLSRGTVICCQETFQNALDLFEFDQSIPPVHLKGVPHPVKVYEVIGSNEKRRTFLKRVVESIGGRDKEIAQITNSYSRWLMSQRERLLITGRSGDGKTTLMAYYQSLMEKNNSVIVCIDKGQEHHQNTMLFCNSQILADLLKAIRDRNFALSREYRQSSIVSGQSKSGMQTRSSFKNCRRSDSMNQSSTSFSGEHPLHEFITESFPAATWDIWSSIPGLMRPKKKKPVVSDFVSKLAMILSRVLHVVSNNGMRVCIILDDMQWTDSYSIELTHKLMQSSPQALFLIVSRPKEEFKASLKLEFQKIMDSSASWELWRRSADTKYFRRKFDPAITKTLLHRTHGNSMLLTSVLKMMKEDGDAVLRDGVLSEVQKPDSSRPAASNSNSIIAQFDKLAVDMQDILRAASVGGQHFRIEILAKIMAQSAQPGKEPSEDEITATLESSDTYLFIKQTENSSIKMFSHFLIQKAILATMVPTRRNALHELYANYYEQTLNSENQSGHLQSLIFHLLKLPGYEDRKQRHVYDAFIDSAESFRSKEAFEFWEILQSFENKIEFAKTPLQKFHQTRLIAQLHVEERNLVQGIESYFEGLSIFGFKWPRSELGQFRAFLTANSFIKKLMQTGEPAKLTLARKYALKTFPVAFHAWTKKTAFKITDDAFWESDAFYEIVEEIVQFYEFAITPMMILKPDMNSVFLCAMQTVMSHLTRQDRDIRLSLCWASMAVTFSAIEFKKLSLASEKLSVRLIEEKGFVYEEAQLSTHSAELYSHIFGARAIRLWGEMLLMDAFANYRIQNQIVDEIGLGNHTKSYFNRWISHMVAAICGSFESYVEAMEEDAEYLEQLEGQEFDAATLQAVKSYYHMTQNAPETAAKYYEESVRHIRSQHGMLDENMSRTQFNEMFLFLVSLSLAHTDSLSYEAPVWNERCAESCLQMVRGFEKANFVQKRYAVPACIPLIPALVDCFLLRKQGAKLERAHELLQLLKKVVPKRMRKDPICTYIFWMHQALNDLFAGSICKFNKKASIALKCASRKKFFNEYLETQMRARILEVRLANGVDSRAPAVKMEIDELCSYFEKHSFLLEAARLAKYQEKSMVSLP